MAFCSSWFYFSCLALVDRTACPQWQTFSSKFTPPKPPQTVLSTGNQVLRCPRLWGQFSLKPPQLLCCCHDIAPWPALIIRKVIWVYSCKWIKVHHVGASWQQAAGMAIEAGSWEFIVLTVSKSRENKLEQGQCFKLSMLASHDKLSPTSHTS